MEDDLPLRILQAEAHKHCPPNHPMGPEHVASVHGAARFYVHLGDRYTAKQIIDAIIEIAGDPTKDEWTQHPRPELVEQKLREAHG